MQRGERVLVRRVGDKHGVWGAKSKMRNGVCATGILCKKDTKATRFCLCVCEWEYECVCERVCEYVCVWV